MVLGILDDNSEQAAHENRSFCYKFATAVDPNKYLKQIKMPISAYTYASISKYHGCE